MEQEDVIVISGVKKNSRYFTIRVRALKKDFFLETEVTMRNVLF